MAVLRRDVGRCVTRGLLDGSFEMACRLCYSFQRPARWRF